MNSKVVIFVGVLTEYQGIDLLLEAVPLVVQKVEHVKFVIVGYPNEQHYREKARALQIEKWTHFTGKISYEDVPRYLSIADVAVSPKISTTEANLKLFGYMAMGLPTVVFDTPINREILGHVGVYAKMGDVKSLAEALIGILTNHERSAELAKLSRQKATDEHSWSGVARRLADIYNSIRKQPRNLSKEQQNGEGASLGYGRSRFHRLPFSKSPARSGPRGHGPG
jgi:glycosyltransferase involved in cell wall biosynthesis